MEETYEVEKVERWKCSQCHKEHRKEVDALGCLKNHISAKIANILWKEGEDLGYIQHRSGFNWGLKYDTPQYKINKDACFRIDYWQCARVPAYRIEHFNSDGEAYVYGCGSWSGGFGEYIAIKDLPEPHPKEEYEYFDRSLDKWCSPFKVEKKGE